MNLRYCEYTEGCDTKRLSKLKKRRFTISLEPPNCWNFSSLVGNLIMKQPRYDEHSVENALHNFALRECTLESETYC